MPNPTTKKCDVCDVTIGVDEKVCPACKADLEELEETISAVERANNVIAKRKARETPEPTPKPKAKSVFGRLSRNI